MLGPMTRKSERELWREVWNLQEESTPEFDVTCSVSIITDEMTDKQGNTIESEVPEPAPPEGHEIRTELPVTSDVVNVYRTDRI